MAQSSPPPIFLSHDPWISPQGWGWAGHSDSASPASSSDSSGACPGYSSRRRSQPDVSMSPESCLPLGSPPCLPHPPCRRHQSQPPWGCWGHGAEVHPSAENQTSSPTFPISEEASPLQSSHLQLGDCLELWPDDLGGSHLGIY
ncbi:mesoderm posterior protein 2 [Echinops telfairi]|uniref:Mesoderm posterior protein 2 n=1 Tax=Echinops telfairi TaxID=9371 RepID=A0ABM0IXB1_ECHTE|nr:mesoderm posterior protein 2 [Echinops telfairi]